VGWLLHVRLSGVDVDPELVMSQLWDLGTTGIHHDETGRLVAGFDDRAAAATAASSLVDAGVVAADSVVVEPAPGPATVGPGDGPRTVTVTSSMATETMTIDANGTFGHGAHQTTAAALELMVELIHGRTRGEPTADRPPELSVLDVGTGSGVLAIAAALAGARPVDAVDVDLHAVETARANSAANGVQVNCSDAAVTDLAASARHGGRRYDVVVANVLAPVHDELAGAIVALSQPTGHVITAGYLDEQADAVTDHYRRAAVAEGGRFEVIAGDSRLGWTAQIFSV
jgi:ribosomal protein L11 methyltransferase